MLRAKPIASLREVPDGTYDIVLEEFVDQGLIVTRPGTSEEQP